jgi:hypothetical protein
VAAGVSSQPGYGGINSIIYSLIDLFSWEIFKKETNNRSYMLFFIAAFKILQHQKGAFLAADQ